MVTVSNLLVNRTAKVDKGSLDRLWDNTDILRSNKEFDRVENL